MATAENGSLQVKNNSRSISPAADALSLLEETDDLQQTQTELTDNGLNGNENMQHPSVEPLTSTPIIQPSNHHSRVIKNNTNQTENGSNGVKNNFNSCDHKTHIENNEDNTSAESGRLGSDFPETCHSVETGSSQNERDSSLTSSGTQTSDDQGHFRIKLLGYEIIEERNKFTVFNIQVKNSTQDKWFLFRRYNDFVRLNDKLKEKFPNFQLALPPKRYLGDNYEKTFLKERQKGLQAFLNLVVGHNEIRNSAAVQDFLCLDNPPGPHESLEESKALCESLEEEVYGLQRELREKNSRISLLEAELDLQRLEIDNLKKSLKYDRNARRRPSNQSLSSTAEHNTSADVDQQRFTPKLHSKECSPFRNSPVRDRITTSSPASIQETNEELPSVEDQVGTDQMM